MEKSKLTSILAKNMTEYRKQSGLTQAELAAKLNYSDKSISKWERGDGTPDIFVLKDLADIYGVTINDLISEEKPKPVVKSGPSKKSKLLITLLSSGLVWLVASLIFFAIKMADPSAEMVWLTFIIAIPIFFIVLIVFTCLWWDNISRCIAVSGLIWSLALTIDICVVVESSVYIYIIAAVLQILAVLWFLLVWQNGIGKSEKSK